MNKIIRKEQNLFLKIGEKYLINFVRQGFVSNLILIDVLSNRKKKLLRNTDHSPSDVRNTVLFIR